MGGSKLVTKELEGPKGSSTGVWSHWPGLAGLGRDDFVPICPGGCRHSPCVTNHLCHESLSQDPAMPSKGEKQYFFGEKPQVHCRVALAKRESDHTRKELAREATLFSS